MVNKNRIANYDKEPEVVVEGYENSTWKGYDYITNEIKSKINKNKFIITVDCYPGVKDSEVLTALISELKPQCVIKSEDVFYDEDKLTSLIKKNLTDDRVFGVMYYGEINDFIDKERIEEIKKKVEDVKSGIVLIYGVAASLINPGDILIYADLARWEIQQRYRRKELGNFKTDNYDEDTLRKYKRAFFIEWRVTDRHKKNLYDKIDYLLDTNIYDDPKMITGDAFREGLVEATKDRKSVV